MRIGELSKRAGVSRDTVRYYERMGLVARKAAYPQALMKPYRKGER